ncbi:MAG: ATP-dependent nuclease [Candidatus Sumerlaeaceae bacterium]
MITRVRLNNFKRFEEQTFDLSDHIVLAGPNNSGKSTLIQAIAVWQLALQRWIQRRGVQPKAKERTGIPITRKDFSAIPLRDMKLLWKDNSTSLTKDELKEGQKLGWPKFMEIGLEGIGSNGQWELAFQFKHQSSEQIYIKPIGAAAERIPDDAVEMRAVHVPPFSGIGAEETRYDGPYQDLLIGQGKPGDILRNLLLEVFDAESKNGTEKPWTQLVEHVEEMFGYRLLQPQYTGRPFIISEYLPNIPADNKGDGGLPRFDVSSAGSGFHQVLLLLAFFYARRASVLLLDEPDAHLHVILQRQVYERLRSVAAERGCQLVIATHSEVLIDGTSPDRIESFYGEPHRLINDVERDQVREALKRVTAMELLLAEKGQGVLYVEGNTDLTLLSAWARVLNHPLAEWFRARAFVHPLRGSDPREAKGHFFALRGVRPHHGGFLLLDSDNRDLPDREVTAQGLQIGRWIRYEAESYLMHPDALVRFVSRHLCKEDEPDLITIPAADQAMNYLRDQLPPAFFRDPLSDHEFLTGLPVSKGLLPAFLQAAGIDLPKRDYYLIAEAMRPDEVSPEVRQMLDTIAGALGVST